MRTTTEFESDGTTLRGQFHRPEASDGPHPVVVMSHGWGATLHMGLEPYAERFAAAGNCVLAYDNPNIGRSDGEPRFEINPWVRARATRDAITHACRFGEVDPDRVAVWGDSGDAARVFLNAATDERIAAVIAYNPTFGSAVPDAPPDPSIVDGLVAIMDAESLPEELEVEYGPALVVSPDPDAESMSPSASAFRWFFEYGGRHGSGWENRWSYTRQATAAPFSPWDCLPRVTVPTLLVVGRDDEVASCDREATRHAFWQLGGTAAWHDVDGGHFGALWTESPTFEQAVSAQVDFLAATFHDAA